MTTIGITAIPVDRTLSLTRTLKSRSISPCNGGAYIYNVNPSAPKGGQLVYPSYNHLRRWIAPILALRSAGNGW